MKNMLKKFSVWLFRKAYGLSNNKSKEMERRRNTNGKGN